VSSIDAWRLSATDLAARIKRREITALQATESVLARIDAVNPRINALAWVSHESALARAAQADREQADGQTLGPLHGVPVTIKINVDVAGEPTTDGVEAFKANIAQTDSPLVQSLRDAGAVIVGRNNAPAFSLRWFTDNAFHGRTLNPFDATRTPGGSSGGWHGRHRPRQRLRRLGALPGLGLRRGGFAQHRRSHPVVQGQRAQPHHQ
jgi:amidase